MMKDAGRLWPVDVVIILIVVIVSRVYAYVEIISLHLNMRDLLYVN